jgi:hypothetical protein
VKDTGLDPVGQNGPPKKNEKISNLMFEELFVGLEASPVA